MRLLRLTLAAAILIAASAFAQAQTNIAPWLPVGGTATLSVTNTSGTVALPWFTAGASQAASSAWVCNKGTKDAYVLMVATSTAVVSTSTGFTVFAGVCNTLAVQNLKYIAGITGGSDTTTLAIQTGSGTPVVGLPGGAGGGGSGTCASLAGDVTGPCSATVVSTIDGFAVSVGGALTTGGVVNIGTSVGTFLTTPSSANLAAAVTDETGTGALVFGTGPSISSPVLSGTSTGTWALGGTPTVASASATGFRDSLLSPTSVDPTVTIGGRGACALVASNTYNTCYGYNAGATFVGTGGGNHALSAFGAGAAGTVTTGADNIAFGADAMNNDDASGSVTGSNNLAAGVHALGHLTSGSANVAIGNESMVGCGNWVGFPACLLTGSSNTGLGQYTLQNITGAAAENTALGFSAGGLLTTGTQNIFVGSSAGANSVTTGSLNILIGRDVRVPSSTASSQLNIGNLITGTGLTQGGSAASGAVTIAGSLTSSGAVLGTVTSSTWNGTQIGHVYGGTDSTASTAYVTVNSTNEIDFFQSNGTSQIFKAIAGGSAYVVVQGGGGATAQVYAGGSSGSTGTLQLGISGQTVSVPSGATFNSVPGYSFNGTPGITKTCTVIPTGITIQGGIITAITGGTCV